jgi:hypothetical protein
MRQLSLELNCSSLTTLRFDILRQRERVMDLDFLVEMVALGPS